MIRLREITIDCYACGKRLRLADMQAHALEHSREEQR